MNAAEQQAAGTRYAQLSAQIADITTILEVHTAAIAMLSRQVQALRTQLEEQPRGTLIDLRGNRLLLGGGK